VFSGIGLGHGKEEENDDEDAVQTVEKLTGIMTVTYDCAMPWSGPPKGWEPTYQRWCYRW